jgi:hypothetical protein
VVVEEEEEEEGEEDKPGTRGEGVSLSQGNEKKEERRGENGGERQQERKNVEELKKQQQEGTKHMCISSLRLVHTRKQSAETRPSLLLFLSPFFLFSLRLFFLSFSL